MTTDRICLTAEQVRELQKTGSVELSALIEPQPLSDTSFKKFAESKWENAGQDSRLPYAFPYGPDGDRWVAEPFCIFDETMRIIYKSTYDPSIEFSHLPEGHGERDFPLDSINWGCAEFMCVDESCLNVTITTTVEQVDGQWWFVTKVSIRLKKDG